MSELLSQPPSATFSFGLDLLIDGLRARYGEAGRGAGCSGGTWVSLTGRGAVVKGVEKKRELWNSAVEAWFPQRPDDASVVPLKVEGDSAKYWDSPGGRLATLISFAKAKVTGQRIDAGENETVDL